MQFRAGLGQSAKVKAFPRRHQNPQNMYFKSSNFQRNEAIEIQFPQTLLRVNMLVNTKIFHWISIMDQLNKEWIILDRCKELNWKSSFGEGPLILSQTPWSAWTHLLSIFTFLPEFTPALFILWIDS